MHKVTVLLSGGIDSSVLLALLKDQGIESSPIFIDYGQATAKREYKAATEISLKMGLNLEKISVPNISKITTNQLTRPEISKNPFYPNRNLLLLTLGSIHAFENKHQGVAIGVIKAIGTIPFPDIQMVFFDKFIDLVAQSLNYELAILTPFIEMSKEEVVAIGKKLNVPLELTYSCLANNDSPCGECESCISRAEVEGDFNI
jgi:7-cyano-7-deazaguanine synthase